MFNQDLHLPEPAIAAEKGIEEDVSKKDEKEIETIKVSEVPLGKYRDS